MKAWDQALCERLRHGDQTLTRDAAAARIQLLVEAFERAPHDMHCPLRVPQFNSPDAQCVCWKSTIDA